MHQYITMPKCGEYAGLAQSFYNLCKLEGAIGILGITQVKIPKPILKSEIYVSQGGYYTLQIQGKHFLKINLLNHTAIQLYVFLLNELLHGIKPVKQTFFP